MRGGAHGRGLAGGARPAHRRLSDRLRLPVLDGRLPLCPTLPGERDLTAALGTSRTTVGTAYRTLVEHGYLATRERARATVRLPGDTPPERRTGTDPSTIDSSFAAPPAPAEILHAAFAAALEHLPRHFERHGYDRNGTTELRQAAAEHLPGVHVPRPPGGMTLGATFPEPVSSRLAAIAPDHGVTIAAGPRFGAGGACERDVRLPYTLRPDRLVQAVRRPAQAERALARGATGTHGPAPVA